MERQIFQKRLSSLGIALSISALSLVSNDARSEGLTVFEIAQHALSSDMSSCTDFAVQGTCFWLVCKAFFCKVKPSPWIKHYSPDVVVSVYNQKGSSPFIGSNTFTNVISLALGRNSNGGEKQSNRNNSSQKSNLIYRLADVYGSPAAYTLNGLLSKFYIACEPRTTILKPYFVSSSNPLFWYSGLVDSVLNIDEIIFGNHYIGERRDGESPQYIKTKPFWGHLFPRIGVVPSSDHFTASSVIAARAMHSVIDGRYDVFNMKMEGRKGKYYEPSEDFEVNSSEHGRWQMLYPKKERGCHILGDESIKGAVGDGYQERRSRNGRYMYHYWSRMKCCNRPKRGKFLFKVTWDS